MIAFDVRQAFNDEDQEHDRVVREMGERFAAAAANAPLFTTDAPDLWSKYLDGFAPELRQYHNCNTCRAFIERFGSLVTIDDAGAKRSAIWDQPSAQGTRYEASFRALCDAAERDSNQVIGVFGSSERRLGDDEKGIRKDGSGAWEHLFVDLPEARVHRSRGLEASQAAAEKAQDVQNVQRALAEFPLYLLNQATALLKTDALFRSEKVLGPVQWLRDLKDATGAIRDKRRSYCLVWRAVASAPAGFCHPRASMAGTLLEDLATGRGFEWAAERFRSKMHPLQYQRPQAAPTAGAIEAAEKLVEKLGIARSLERRFARLEEIDTIWRPAETPAVVTDGVFGHLRPKSSNVTDITLPPKPITWARFVETVLPTALRIEARVPHSGHFCALLTAEHTDAPPILQWDSDDDRNPVSWYVYNGGSLASQWGLTSGWRSLTAIALRPSMWRGRKIEHQGRGAVFVIPGCVDSRENSGNAIFPETLRSELHGARSVIEAYSKTATIRGSEQASACGLAFDGGNGSVGVRVHVPGGVVAEYQIDRWE
jgi:hypothetical protein